MSGTQIAGTLTPTESQAAQSIANVIPTNVTSVVSPNTFVFWAGFDGTRNNAGDPALAGDTQSTAIGAKWTNWTKRFAPAGIPDDGRELLDGIEQVGMS